MISEAAIQIFITAILAAFGALARLLSQKEKTAVQLANMISGCLVAAFTGVMAHFVSEYFTLSPSLTYAIAGISGWIGPQVLDLLTNLILQKAGLNVRVNSKEDDAAFVPKDASKPISGTFFENMQAMKPQPDIPKNTAVYVQPPQADIPKKNVYPAQDSQDRSSNPVPDRQVAPTLPASGSQVTPTLPASGSKVAPTLPASGSKVAPTLPASGGKVAPTLPASGSQVASTLPASGGQVYSTQPTPDGEDYSAYPVPDSEDYSAYPVPDSEDNPEYDEY